MGNCERFLHAELPLIRKIIENETWLEGERRGHSVDEKDPEVLLHVIEIIQTNGQKMRDFVQKNLDSTQPT